MSANPSLSVADRQRLAEAWLRLLAGRFRLREMLWSTDQLDEQTMREIYAQFGSDGIVTRYFHVSLITTPADSP